MLTKNNWVTTNIKQRISDPSLDFQVTLNPYEFEKVDFKTASSNVAIEIGENYKNLFLSLSGGLDSEFLLRLFTELNIQIQPVIVSGYDNSYETSFAFAACDELKINPIILKPSDQDIIDIFANIIEKFSTPSRYTVYSIIAANYIHNQNGIFLSGAHLLGESEDPVDELYSNDWDFFPEEMNDGLIHIAPLMYTPQIVYASVNNITEDCQIHKTKLYNLAIREKRQPIYNLRTARVMDLLVKHRRKYKPSWNCSWKINEIFK